MKDKIPQRLSSEYKPKPDPKTIAQQLRKPTGEFAIQVGKKMNEKNLHMNRYAIEKLNLQPNDNLLEIGMGNGFLVNEILSPDNTIKYTGCDYSEIMVEEANKLNNPFIRQGQAQFCMASADNLPFEDNSFDKVFTVNTIYFWDKPENELSEIRRVLKPQGEIMIAIRPKATMQKLPFVRHGFKLFSKSELTDVLTSNNFSITDILEKKEPDLEVDREAIKAETVIVCAKQSIN